MISVQRIGRLLGIDVGAERMAELLTPLGFAVDASGDTLEVSVPSHRLDVTSDADVAEEVARAHGYERIPGRLPHADLPPYRPDPSEPRNRVRSILAGLGLDETVSHALIGPLDLERTRYPFDGTELIRIFNPLSEEHSILRPVLYPSLLGGVAENARRRQLDVRLFELGKVYWYHPDRPTGRDRQAETAGTGRYESWEVGIILAGDAAPAYPGEPPRPSDVADVKGIVDALHDAVGAPRPAYRPEDPAARHAHRHPGRTAVIADAAGHAYGSLGEVHPAVVEAWGLTGRPVDAALSLDRLLGLVPGERRSRPIPAAQPVDRDLAVVVDEATPIGDVLRVARLSAGPLLTELRLFDTYRGEQIGPGRVSYALSFRFQPDTPGDAKAIDKALKKVRGSLGHHLGADIR